MNIFDTNLARSESVNYKLNKFTTVKEQGSNVDKVYFIKEGKVSIQEETLEGETVQLKTLEQDECFGELELFSSEKCYYQIVTLTDCQIVAINHNEVIKCMKEDFRIVQYLYESICSKLRNSSKYIIQTRTKTVYERLLMHILDFSDNGVYILEKEKLALNLNTTVRSLNRSLLRASHEELITVNKNIVDIVSVDTLKRYLKSF
ncbi:Crp/Fnr family transcriptional regulator [Lactococcus lactis]|uniref:Crp/Fnr family transcriptional regulator n=1 Tax=Lactococcus lactis TaxID=1358 RepID=UPI0032E4EB5A